MQENETPIPATDSEAPKPPRPKYREKPLKGRGRHGYIGAFTTGARIVKLNCYDVSKENAYHRRYPHALHINRLEVFLTGHDFAKDPKYLNLTRELNFYHIELAKYLAVGENMQWALKLMYPEAKYGMRKQRFQKHTSQGREAIVEPLVDYFRTLLGKDGDAMSYSVEEAFRSLVTDVRAAKAGKERSDLTYRLIEMFGMEKALKEEGAKVLGGHIENPGTGGASLAQAKALAGISNGAAQEAN